LDVEDKHTVVGPVGDKQAASLAIHRHTRPTADVIRRQAAFLGPGVGLAQDRHHGFAGFDPVRMDVEDHDLASAIVEPLTGLVVDDKQPLVEVIDCHRAGKFNFAFMPMARVGPAREGGRLAQNVFSCRLCERAVLVQFEDFDSPVAVRRYKQPSMDAIQRPLRRSPNAVPGRTAVGDASNKGWITQQVFLAERIARRLPVSLCQECGSCPDTE
jgi:hypothetical protein